MDKQIRHYLIDYFFLDFTQNDYLIFSFKMTYIDHIVDNNNNRDRTCFITQIIYIYISNLRIKSMSNASLNSISRFIKSGLSGICVYTPSSNIPMTHSKYVPLLRSYFALFHELLLPPAAMLSLELSLRVNFIICKQKNSEYANININ